MNKTTEALKMLDDWLDDYTPDEVRKALKEALESQEQSYQHKWDKSGERCVKCGDKDWMGGKCNVADSQEQEPVAWMGNYSNTSSLAFQKEALKDAKEIIPLYIHPAQALSAVELSNIFIRRDVNGDATRFARAIEQAHGIGVKDATSS